jgi:hypothetical protein
MATNNHSRETDSGVRGSLLGTSRIWNLFAIRAFATIVARKHNVVVPLDGVDDLSDEELTTRLRLVSELAHLPPA